MIQDITVQHADSPVVVRAYVAGSVAVHACLGGDGYTITHVASGLRFTDRENIFDAMASADQLALLDWSAVDAAAGDLYRAAAQRVQSPRAKVLTVEGVDPALYARVKAILMPVVQP